MKKKAKPTLKAKAPTSEMVARAYPASCAEDTLVVPDEDEAREAEEDRLRDSQPWRILHSLDRARSAVSDVCDRLRKDGDEADAQTLLAIVFDAIRALEASPNARERMRRAKEWPSFVSGGKESGPLRKAWAKQFASRHVGEDNPEIPKKGSLHLEAGKPAWLAKSLFDELEELRRSGLQALNIAEPEYMTAARELPPLSKESIEKWRELSLLTLDSQFGTWVYCAQRLLPGRYQTAMSKLQKKADKGAGYRAGIVTEFDEGTAKSMVSWALLEGFRALLKIK